MPRRPIGSLVTEFTGVAGIGEMFGLRARPDPAAGGGSAARDRRQRAPIGGSSGRRSVIGLFELAFFVVAWAARPEPGGDWLAEADRLPLGDRHFLYMAAAIIGATFNPWMVFYQQSATVDKRLQPADLRHALDRHRRSARS